MRTSRSKRGIRPLVKAKPVVETRTVPEAVEEKVKETPLEKVAAEKEIQPEPEMKAEDEPGGAIVEELNEREGLISEILGILEDTPDGLRMVELAETLGVENWRSLIPIMKELLDDGDVKKEDSTYFIA